MSLPHVPALDAVTAALEDQSEYIKDRMPLVVYFWAFLLAVLVTIEFDVASQVVGKARRYKPGIPALLEKPREHVGYQVFATEEEAGGTRGGRLGDRRLNVLEDEPANVLRYIRHSESPGNIVALQQTLHEMVEHRRGCPDLSHGLEVQLEVATGHPVQSYVGFLS